jgi:hypothetical protein
LQSIIPLPVIWRSLFTSAAVICDILKKYCNVRS